ENIKFVLTEECHDEPAHNALKAVLEAYNRWIQVNNKVRYYLLAGMSKVLRTKHESMEIAYEIMESLQLVFG
ncbi:hypothetical protein, partial [Proteus mirabilis]|uniref:hypothetical protein n=1 Tax=Proteus mirabilis TaxID=584 RepID=UPI001C131372